MGPFNKWFGEKIWKQILLIASDQWEVEILYGLHSLKCFETIKDLGKTEHIHGLGIF